MKQLKLFLTIFVIATSSYGQTKNNQNSIYLEAGGNGLFASINYERQLTKDPKFGIRLGIGFYSENTIYLTFPVGVNYLFRLKNEKSFIDAGFGATFTKEEGKIFINSKKSNGDYFTNFIPSIGYRKHVNQNLMWRISITPVINNYGFTPWLGFSIGKRF
jgi:hypothetical protein